MVAANRYRFVSVELPLDSLSFQSANGALLNQKHLTAASEQHGMRRFAQQGQTSPLHLFSTDHLLNTTTNPCEVIASHNKATQMRKLPFLVVHLAAAPWQQPLRAQPGFGYPGQMTHAHGKTKRLFHPGSARPLRVLHTCCGEGGSLQQGWLEKPDHLLRTAWINSQGLSNAFLNKDTSTQQSVSN